MINGKLAVLFPVFIAFLFITPSYVCGQAAAGEIDISSYIREVAVAQFDKAAEIKKALGLKGKLGVEGAEQDREVGRLMLCFANLKSISVALEMYAADKRGRYPDSLRKLMPQYLRTMPRYYSAKGEFGFNSAYRLANNGKSYVLTCNEGAFTGINVPAGYPRYTPEKGIEMKPGVFEPQPSLSPKEKAMKLFEDGVKDLPEIMQSKSREKAAAARAKLRAAIDSGGLDPSMKTSAESLIKKYDEIIKGSK
ncbi:MAG: hypothetical protein AB2L14_32515 [Candidatus Xenobiia bacterium LiM19]